MTNTSTDSNKTHSLNLISSDILSFHCKSLTSKNEVSISFNKVTTPLLASLNSLCFANSESLIEESLKNNCSGIILTEKLFETCKEKYQDSFSKIKIWTTPHIQMSMTEVLPYFNFYNPINQKIHSTAFIDASAKISENCIIEPYAVIGKNVIIGDHTKIGAHTVIENGATIGHHTQISSHVHIGYNCHIGHYCIIGPHNTFGADGFGFFTDKTGTHHKIPQIGNVIIEDHCEFGAHNAVDRATLTETRIRKGSKFDNYVHIAHNCDIGENAMITAGFIVAGSTKIGKNITTAGGVHVNGHITVADHVILTARAGVVSSIEKSGIYGGYPAVDHKESLRIMTSQMALPKMRKQLTKILKHLGITED